MRLQFGSPLAASLSLSPSPFSSMHSLSRSLSLVPLALSTVNSYVLCLLPQLLLLCLSHFLSLPLLSSTADCHFALRCHFPHTIELRLRQHRLSVSFAFPAAVDIVYLFTVSPFPALSSSVSPLFYTYLAGFLFIFCCVCSVCAIECNK